MRRGSSQNRHRFAASKGDFKSAVSSDGYQENVGAARGRSNHGGSQKPT